MESRKKRRGQPRRHSHSLYIVSHGSHDVTSKSLTHPDLVLWEMGALLIVRRLVTGIINRQNILCTRSSNQHSTVRHISQQFNGIRRNTYAIPAAWRVDKKPHIMADTAIRAITFPREGARAPKTPIWIPIDPRLAKPHSPYDRMVYPRWDRGATAWSAFRSR